MVGGDVDVDDGVVSAGIYGSRQAMVVGGRIFGHQDGRGGEGVKQRNSTSVTCCNYSGQVRPGAAIVRERV